MKYIYYPEYELEYTNLLERRTPLVHILNIKILMFLCDHVILPPSHLLYTSSENILSLISNLSDFFHAGKIVTTCYQNGLNDYFSSRIERINDPILKLAKENQVKEITEKLFLDSSVEQNKSDEKMQLSLFDTRLKELIHTSTKHKKKSLILLEHMDLLSNKTGEPVYSNQFRDILTDMLNNKDITKMQNGYFMNLMSNAYYYSGTYTMNTLVSYNSYFEKINLHDCLVNTHTRATNLIVNPYFLRSLFGIMGINMQDIYQLSVHDYNEIMSHKYWGKFMDVFETLYTNAEELNELLMHRDKLMEVYRNRKDNIFKVLDIVTNNLVLSILLNPTPPVVGIGIPLIISALRSFLFPLTKLESYIKNNTSDKIIDLIIRNNDPLYEFSYRLNLAINALR